MLKIWHEHTFEEMSELLHLSPNTVAGRYRYGMEKLRACLKEEQYEDTEFIGRADAVVGAAAAFRAT